MVLTLCQQSKYSKTMALVSLEGTTNEAKISWPDLRDLAYFKCLNKPQGISLASVNKLIELIDEWEIDTIHSHHVGPLLYAAVAKLKRPKIKHIHTMHDAWYLQNFRQRIITQAVFTFTDVTVVTDAQAVALELTSKTLIKADHVVHNGIDTQLFRPFSKYLARCRLGLPTNKKLIGCAARVEKGKGHTELMSSLKNLPEYIDLVFAGDGSEKENYESFAKDIGVENRIHWLGKVNTMPLFYSSVDLFCLFSQREGLPLTLLEAMSCNIPIVASDVGGISEVINNQNGILLNRSMVEKLPDALQRGLSFKNGGKIRSMALEIGCSKQMAKSYDLLYEKIRR